MKQFMPYLMALLMLGILIGAYVYLVRRFSFYFSVENSAVMYIGFAVLMVFMIGGLAALSNAVSGIGSLLYISAATLLGISLYVLLSTLLVDAIGLFSRFHPMSYGIAALGLALVFSLYGMINTFQVRDHAHEIEMDHLQKEVKIMHWSDVHLGHFRGKKFLADMVERSNATDADMLVITGDLFDGRIQISEEVMKPLKRLKMPVYFVEGNHDKYSGVKQIKDLLRDIGVRVLENEVVEVNGIQLVGLNHMLADSKKVDMHATSGGATIESTMAKLKIDKDRPSVLLHHSPDGIEYVNAAGVDLYLCGHTHGGQQFPVTILNSRLFKFNKGLYDYEDTKVFVSMGVGTFGPPLRIGTQGELVLLNLLPGK